MSKQIKEVKRELERIYGGLDDDTTSLVLQMQCIEAKDRLQNLLQIQEENLQQQSKINWLQLGDQNIIFFSEKTKQRLARNSLLSRLSREGQPVTSREILMGEAKNYFKNLYMQLTCDQTPPQPSFPNILTEEMLEYQLPNME